MAPLEIIPFRTNSLIATSNLSCVKNIEINAKIIISGIGFKFL